MFIVQYNNDFIILFSGGRKVEPRGEPPHFSDILKAIKVNHGDSAILECKVTGTPTPKIVWFHGDKEITASNEFKQDHDPSTGKVKLTIHEVFIDDKGLYRAIAVNEHGKDETTAYVTVEGIELLEINDLRQSPRITSPINAQIVAAGSPIKLWAKYDAYPPPNIKWYRNGTEIKRVNDLVIQVTNSQTTLNIDEVFEDDSGEYEVRIFNEAGEARSCATLRVVSKYTTLNIRRSF